MTLPPDYAADAEAVRRGLTLAPAGPDRIKALEAHERLMVALAGALASEVALSLEVERLKR